ncbi:MAG: hypothetical protein SFU56_02560 [Capsulimonadales bacterium]|nr:hypothetical protein [Capsulimonadales bacterium]
MSRNDGGEAGVANPAFFTPPPEGATARWPFLPRFVLLNAGLVVYGLALAAMIRADVGLAPWDAFHYGLARTFPFLKIGQASIVVGLVCQLIAYFALRMPIGIGSVSNMILIGIYIDLFLPWLPSPGSPFLAWCLFLSGILVSGIATGTYIASRFGAGPRDSLALGLSGRFGWPIKQVRTGIELTVLLSGFLLGANIGWGTLAFALLMGPAMSLGMSLYGLRR